MVSRNRLSQMTSFRDAISGGENYVTKSPRPNDVILGRDPICLNSRWDRLLKWQIGSRPKIASTNDVIWRGDTRSAIW